MVFGGLSGAVIVQLFSFFFFFFLLANGSSRTSPLGPRFVSLVFIHS